jgi:hypothetical protein
MSRPWRWRQARSQSLSEGSHARSVASSLSRTESWGSSTPALGKGGDRRATEEHTFHSELWKLLYSLLCWPYWLFLLVDMYSAYPCFKPLPLLSPFMIPAAAQLRLSNAMEACIGPNFAHTILSTTSPSVEVLCRTPSGLGLRFATTAASQIPIAKPNDDSSAARHTLQLDARLERGLHCLPVAFWHP